MMFGLNINRVSYYIKTDGEGNHTIGKSNQTNNEQCDVTFSFSSDVDLTEEEIKEFLSHIRKVVDVVRAPTLEKYFDDKLFRQYVEGIPKRREFKQKFDNILERLSSINISDKINSESGTEEEILKTIIEYISIMVDDTIKGKWLSSVFAFVWKNTTREEKIKYMLSKYRYNSKNKTPIDTSYNKTSHTEGYIPIVYKKNWDMGNFYDKYGAIEEMLFEIVNLKIKIKYNVTKGSSYSYPEMRDSTAGGFGDHNAGPWPTGKTITETIPYKLNEFSFEINLKEVLRILEEYNIVENLQMGEKARGKTGKNINSQTTEQKD